MQILGAQDVVEIYVLWHSGWTKSAVARHLGFDRKTVRTYIGAAERAGRRPGDRQVTRSEWEAFVRQWFPFVADARQRQATWAELDAHRDRIDTLLGALPVAEIHRALRHEVGLCASLASLRRYVRANCGSSRGERLGGR